MGFRFRKTIKILPGVRLNLSKSGGSISIGPRGAKLTVGPRGVRATVGIPGSGISYTTTSKQLAPFAKPKGNAGKSGLDLSFLEKLTLSEEEKTFVEGCQALYSDHLEEAFARFKSLPNNADAAFIAGVLAFQNGALAEAETFLLAAEKDKANLRQSFAKYDLAPTFQIAITEEITAEIGADEQGVMLALAEVSQAKGDWEAATQRMRQFLDLAPDDVIARLSLEELLWDHKGEDQAALQEIVTLTGSLQNTTPLHTALLLYKAKALGKLGLLDAAKDILSEALKRKKDRPAELLLALQYERAAILSQQGQDSQARKDFESIYAQDPNYEDVAQRLGLK